ncbi:MAG: bifunctional (p)ppGpp synthetase/guanosine-3',5'-bis(diphosphate) 3'-pyrophosphohydrolase [Actinobacteria bacterium]|nr:bifunctional (p)ppGpp synthetase/guanosine-3',5'-bis(diphosphate) 3'-pyrophosphohydrolase [Actinomycetota bacterium]
MVDYRKLINKIKKYNPEVDEGAIKGAYALARDLHSDQFRKSGEDFVSHPKEVADILADLQMDTPTIIAGLLHDVVEDTDAVLDDVKPLVGSEVCELIDGVTKLGQITFKSREEEQAENLRKMLIAMAKDVRIIIIKLADRLHNMRTVCHLNKEKQQEKAMETLEIYAPLAHRLGIMQIKWELEDLAFEVLEPKMYEQIQKRVTEKRSEREDFLNEFIKRLKKELKGVGIEAEISGRPKHFYSIYMKMVEKGKDFSEIYDLSAIRVIVNSIKDCYGTLGTIHTFWKPIPGRFKDYIAMPKFNMYQSLHTSIIGPGGRPLEIQIRTEPMHRTAEYGIAAHWRYKEGGKDEKFDERLAWLRQMLEWQNELKDPREFMETLKIDLFQDEVYVFTPKGDVMSLQAGATPLDFAYGVHTDVGHRCIGAKVNNQIVPLEYELRTGDFVEILTSKTSTGPSQDWLKMVKTSRARNKIRQWFSRESREVNISLGRDAVYKELRRYGTGLKSTAHSDILEKIAHELSYKTVDDLFGAIGAGKVSPKQVAGKIAAEVTGAKSEEPDEISFEFPRRRGRQASTTGVRVKDIDDVLIRLAQCCNPVPYDEIIGFITRGRGVSIHRRDCINAKQLLEQPERLIEVKWDAKQAAAFKVEILVEAIDRPKLLRDISTVLGEAGLNILSGSVNASKGHIAFFRFVFEIGNLGHLKQVLDNIKRVSNVVEAYRVEPGKEEKQTLDTRF